MGHRRTRIRHQAYIRVIHRIWTSYGRVTHNEFNDSFRRARAHMSHHNLAAIPYVSQQTFSYYYRKYCQLQHIHRRSYRWIKNHLLNDIQDGRIDTNLREQGMMDLLRAALIRQKIIVPAPDVLRRLVRSARMELTGQRREQRIMNLEQSLGIVLDDVPAIQRFRAAQELLRYPPAWRGKANLQTMARESKIMAELADVIRANNLPIEKIVASPMLRDRQDLVERLRPSYLTRREHLAIVESLPFYLVGRWRDARDVVLACLVRKARLLRYNLKKLNESYVRDASLSFLEQASPRFGALHRAVVKSLATGSIDGLRRHRAFLAELEREGIGLAERTVYYRLLSGRGGYVRKMARKLENIPFEAHDPRAKAVITILPEVFRFAPFRVPVPESTAAGLSFLAVPIAELKRRKIFETVVIMTLADLVWSGRVTVPGSVRYRNRWSDVPALQSTREQDSGRAHWIADLRRRLEAAAGRFRQYAKEHTVLRDGRLHVPRARYTHGDEGDDEEERSIVPSHPPVRLPSIDIVDLMREVHGATGLLDAFQLDGPAPHRLPDDERRELAVAVLIGDGLNLGLKEVSRSIGHGFRLGRLRNFAANYVISRKLRAASARVIAMWDKLGLGLPWGSGRACSVDGRVVRSNSKNIFSSYHRRKGKVGVTIYWVVRDDYLASSVRIIGNQEWESWYVLDDLQQPTGEKPLEVSTGDTHGQHLAAWGLADLIGKRLTVRFRQLGTVKLYGLRNGRWCGIQGVKTIDWNLLRRASPSLHRLAAAVRKGDVVPSEVLRVWNLYDENGINVMEALRELGKVPRTEFILEYARDPAFREEIHNNCQRAETWNSFQDAVFFGNGGRVATNSPRRRDEMGFAMGLVMNCIVFHNAWKWGSKLRKVEGATPVVWSHVRFHGRYKFTKRRHPSEKSKEVL